MLFVDEKLVPADAPSKGFVAIQGMERKFSVERPLVLIDVETPYFQGNVCAAALEDPIYPVLIGNSVTLEDGTVHQVPYQCPAPALSLAVSTRAQARHEKQRVHHIFPQPTLVNRDRMDLQKLQTQGP